MGFSWTTIDKGTIITSSQWNEIKANIDTLCDNLGISHYNWSELPVNSNTNKPDISDIQELRNALDYVHDNNVCYADYSTHNSSIKSGYDSSVNNSVNTSVDTSDDSGVYSSKDITNYAGHDSSVQSNKDVSYYSSQNTSILSGKDSTVYSNLHSGYYTTKYTSH